MSKFIKLEQMKNNPLGGEVFLKNVWINVDHIITIEECGGKYELIMLENKRLFVDKGLFDYLIQNVQVL